MFKTIDLHFESSKKLNDFSQGKLDRYSEMTEFQRAFVCGLLREKKPQKVLEIGVAAGGTTAVILECLQELGLSGVMYSVDISEQWYRGGNKRTGFLKDELIADDGAYKHTFILGKAIPHVIEEIGDNIDFLILDTTHILPGELLDFLVCYPFLNKTCTVVLHDVAENMITGKKTEIATKLLFDVIRADKYYMLDKDEYAYGFSNIAAFTINDQTATSIDNLFSALSFSWNYGFSNEDKEAYGGIINKNYPTSCYQWYLRVAKMHEYTALEGKIRSHYGKDLSVLKLQWESADCVYVYGGGYWAELYTRYANINGLSIAGYIISEEYEKKDSLVFNKFDLPVLYPGEVDDAINCAVVLGVDVSSFRQCTLSLKKSGISRIL